MDNTVLGQLLEQGESARVEFVSGTDLESHVEEAACAFLNDQGGVILAGVKGDGRLVGVPGAEAKAQTANRAIPTFSDKRGDFIVTLYSLTNTLRMQVRRNRLVLRLGALNYPATAGDGQMRWRRGRVPRTLRRFADALSGA